VDLNYLDHDQTTYERMDMILMADQTAPTKLKVMIRKTCNQGYSVL
jgi:hypothetical protein